VYIWCCVYMHYGSNQYILITGICLKFWRFWGYFQFQDTLYIQKDGLVKGAPTSSLFSEIYLQHIENTKIVDILIQHQIIGYFRYVDDMLIVLKKDTTDIYDILNRFNNIMPAMKFTIEEEKGNKINFLDTCITIIKKSRLIYTENPRQLTP
jgi:hypothetical protein